jgi:hypothetical protein
MATQRDALARLSRVKRLLALTIAVSSPCWCCLAAGSLNGLYRYWIRYTPEDRDFLRNDRMGYTEGLPSAGRRLKAEMEAIPDPEAAIQQYPDWRAVRFSSGEWIFGYGIDSHGFSVGRGTLVVKDSRGKVRIFFGHVCGENAQLLYPPHDVSTLDGFYRALADYGTLREWNPDL